MGNDAVKIMHLLEFADSTFPVGAFSFSNGLETASHEGIVHNAATLEEFARTAAVQAAFSDGVAALHAFRNAQSGSYEGVVEADMQVILCKMNAEARQMITRMGKKMAEISNHILDSSLMQRWAGDIADGKAPGTYPVAQAIAFSSVGLSELELFCAHQYGVINMILSAALRCVKVSHYDTQRILFKLSEMSEHDYEVAKSMSLEDMNVFNPQLDILASLHEKGSMRMFMN